MNRSIDHFRSALAAALVLLFVAVPASARQEADRPAAAETAPPPTLDDLLGLDEDEQDDGAAAAAEREAEEELQRQLAEEEVGDAFAAAVQKMAISAELLDRQFDAGLGTQRIQEDVIAKLDQLIEFAKQQSSPCSSSSASSASNSDSESTPQPKPGGQQPSSGQRNPNPSDSQEGDPPGRQNGDINTVLEETRTEWGGLPPRIRDELLQGRSDKYSALYEQLTRQYYQRLAEEGDAVIVRLAAAAAIVIGLLPGLAAASTSPPVAPGGAAPVPAKVVSDTGAQNNPLAGEMTADLQRSVNGGFAYLKSMQNADGSFGRGRYGKHVGITALCGIAYMADGNLPGRGPYGENVRLALEFVLDHATESGLLAAETSHGPMYGHGFATLFLGEIYGMNPHDKRVREALVRAVDLIVGTQNEEGGWRYNPVPYDADISVTICQIMALRSARNAGIKVPKRTIDNAVDYVRRCQNPDGGFKYMLQAGGSAWPRTAAGVASLFYAGIWEDDSIDRGLKYLGRNAMPGTGASGQAHYYYGHYYAVQAMYLAGGEAWSEWWPAVREELIAKQSSSGGWLDHHAGGAYATAMSLIILQMPKRYLPIFQK